MDWITGIQNAINYIENNITEELDYEVIVHSALLNGRWCGDQRPPCGLSGRLIMC